MEENGKVFIYYYGNGMEMGIRLWEWEGMGSKSHSCTCLVLTGCHTSIILQMMHLKIFYNFILHSITIIIIFLLYSNNYYCY